MYKDLGVFPFGKAVVEVRQADDSPKSVFILGVYASAVHARWIGANGRELVKSLAVCSEPEIFWNGSNQDLIIERIIVPNNAGKLKPSHLNGESGKALDKHFLAPLLLKRSQVWLSDLLPFFHVRPGSNQEKRIHDTYNNLAVEKGWPVANIRKLSTKFETTVERVYEIVAELVLSGADILITLGDDPLRLFTSRFDQSHRTSLNEYTTYGNTYKIEIDGRSLLHLPLVHPRQAGRLGNHSSKWSDLHDHWKHRDPGRLI